MGSYVGLLIDQAGVVRDIRRIESEHDHDAIKLMKELLAQSHEFVSAEVWRCRDRVAKVLCPYVTQPEASLAPLRRGRPGAV